MGSKVTKKFKKVFLDYLSWIQYLKVTVNPCPILHAVNRYFAAIRKSLIALKYCARVYGIYIKHYVIFFSVY